MAKQQLHLVCPDGFSYIEPNKVAVYLAGVNVSKAVGNLFNAWWDEEDSGSGEDHWILIVGDDYFVTIYGESFCLEDFAAILENIFALEVVCHDGVQWK